MFDQLGSKRCYRCGARKPSADFHNSRTGQFSYCKLCRRDYDRAYYQRNKEIRLARNRRRDRKRRADFAQNKAGPCADCGGVFPPVAMHWDHLPGHVKVGDISTILVRRGPRLLEEELAKCELVCANCHAIRTASRRAGA